MVAATEDESTHQGENPEAKRRTGAVYVMSNQDIGNSVTVFDRAADGGLTRKGTFPTGGLGAGNGHDLEAAADPLNSQGSLILSEDQRFLFAVDAGSNEVSSLAIDGERLIWVDRVPSGGVRPVSLTVHDNLLYVVNAGGPPPNSPPNPDATIAGFTVGPDGKLSPVEGSVRSLIGGPGAGPSQIQFSPDRTQLVVTERQTNVIDVFPIDEYGRAGSPVRNESNGPAPFTATFHGEDVLLVTEVIGVAFTIGSASTYRLAKNGTLRVISGSVNTTELAACWTVDSIIDPNVTYVANAQSGSISGFRFDDTGAISLFPPDGHIAVVRDSHATQDMALSSDGQFLYVLTAGFDEKLADPRLPTFVDGAPFCGRMSISAFRVEARGGLTPLRGYGVADDSPRVIGPGVLAPSMGGLPPGSEGLVAI